MKSQHIRMGFFVVLSVLAALYVRVTYDSNREYNLGMQQSEANETTLAIGHLRRAARSYVPFGDLGFARHVAALDQLKIIGFKAEEAKAYAQALSAWRSIRAATLGSRSFFTPFPERLNEANRHIAHIMTLVPKPPMDANKTNEVLEREHLQLLQHSRRPNSVYGGLAIVFLICFLMYGYKTADQLEASAEPSLVPVLRQKTIKTLGFAFASLIIFFLMLYLA